MKRKIGWIAGLVVVLAAGAAGAYWWFNKDEKQLAANYLTAQVRKGALEVKVSGTGNIQASARSALKASVSATAEKVNFKKGDVVKKGDILATYVQEDISNQLRSKDIDLKKKELELTDLQTRYKQAEDEDSRASMALSIQKQQLDIEMAKEDIASLKSDKRIEPLVAPIDGVLTVFDVEAGDTVNPNGDIGEIVNLAELQMVVGIDELDIPKVKLDQEATILVEALPDQTFTGKVVSIADEGTASNGVASFEVTILLTETENLKVGMSAEASIMTNKKDEALYLPIEAVQSFQGNYYVMVPAAAGTASGQAGQNGQSGQGGEGAQPGQSGQDGQGGRGRFQNMTDEERAAFREQMGAGRGNMGAAAAGGTGANISETSRVPVQVGINNEDYIEIVSGLSEGDTVVLPTVASSGTTNTPQGFGGFGGGAFTGGGGFPGGGAGAGGGGGAGGGVRMMTGGGGGR